MIGEPFPPNKQPREQRMPEKRRSSLQGRLVLVTGASSGIGAATAADLAERGARLVLLARSADRLGRVADGIENAGGEARSFAVDLSDSEAVRKIADRIREETGAPDILVNCAGAGRWLAAVDTHLDDFRRTIETPYLAAAYITRTFLPDMISRGAGRIAFVTSPASWLVWPNAAGYIASRHALKGFAEALREEVEPHGVGVTLVTLGTVSSPYWEHNPGSREHLPRPLPLVMPELSVARAGEIVADAIEQGRNRAFKPGIFRILAVLDALLPGSIIR